MDTKLRYTALSRAKKISQISFDEKIKSVPNPTFKKNIEKKIKSHIEFDKEKGYETNIDADYIMKLFKKQIGSCAKCDSQMKNHNYYKNPS